MKNGIFVLFQAFFIDFYSTNFPLSVSLCPWLCLSVSVSFFSVSHIPKTKPNQTTLDVSFSSKELAFIGKCDIWEKNRKVRENIRKVGNILISCPFLTSLDLLSPLYSSPSLDFLTPQAQSDEIMGSFTYDTRKMLLKGKGNKIFSALTQPVTCFFLLL